MQLLRDYLQLLRFPNVFTALADVLAGAWFVRESLSPDANSLALLLACSACLYLAGMVLNDVFDLEVDRKERPQRPLPSGRIPLGVAKMLGGGLLVGGILAGWIAASLQGDPRRGLIATLLATCVVGYDAVLKKTPLGPVVMGACRGLNILLGMSLGAEAWSLPNYCVAGGMMIYITGVTWFARREAGTSRKAMLAAALIIIELGIFVIAQFPYVFDVLFVFSQRMSGVRWNTLMAGLGVLIGYRCLRAVLEPSPKFVQRAVKNCLMSIIVLDAAVVMATRGMGSALVVLLLLAPAMYLGRWLYST